MDIKITVNTKKTAQVSSQARQSQRDSNLVSPVKQVKLKWWEEQVIYDRMFEAQRPLSTGQHMYYRSTVAERWHSE